VTPSEPLDLTIVTGMSGAGRSAAADVLEDLGYFVVDNLPPALIPKFAELARTTERATRHALVVDVRSGEFVNELMQVLHALERQGAEVKILFVDAADSALVQRYEASRRPHPLSEGGRLIDGIVAERSRLEELKGVADVVIDTTTLNVHELRDRLERLFGGGDEPRRLRVDLVSFGYKHGLPLDVDLVLDCRFLPNPHWVDDLRPLPGTDQRVRDFVLDQADTKEFLDLLDNLFELVLPAYEREGKAYLSIAIGCTGGRHRSVAIADALAARLEAAGRPAKVHHRDLDRE
jgi:UPF0042 nucleotide-binding protein